MCGKLEIAQRAKSQMSEQKPRKQRSSSNESHISEVSFDDNISNRGNND
jgi:hypothetical protein